MMAYLNESKVVDVVATVKVIVLVLLTKNCLPNRTIEGFHLNSSLDTTVKNIVILISGITGNMNGKISSIILKDLPQKLIHL